MKKHYIDGPFGQVHIRQWGEDSVQAPLICLTPSPFSSVAYTSLAPMLCGNRKVFAVDYPGYGLSDACLNEPSIADFAEAVQAVIDVVSPDRPVDLLGFHTGCLVATETSLLCADKVGRLVLIDVPFFDQAKQAELLAKTPVLSTIEPELSGLEQAWDFCIGKRLEHIPLPRAYDMFLDYVGAGENANAAFRAAFQYQCEQRFTELAHPTWVIATAGGLFDASVRASGLIPNSNLIELKEVTVAVLEKGARHVSGAVLKVLS